MVAFVTAWAVLTRPVAKVTTDDGRPQSWPVSELPRHLFRGGPPPPAVEVAFPFPLTSTGDPLVWLYHPGYPPKTVPATYEVRFRNPPPAAMGLPVIVSGSPSFRPDRVRRPSAVLGVVVISDAILASP